MRLNQFSTAWLMLLLSGCGFVHDEHIVGRYREVAADVDEQMSICEETNDSSVVACVVPPTVFARGHNADFIIAKQHPMNELGNDAPDRAVTTFWIVRVDDRMVFGPLTEASFQAERIRLRIPDDLHFTTIHEDLE